MAVVVEEAGKVPIILESGRHKVVGKDYGLGPLLWNKFYRIIEVRPKKDGNVRGVVRVFAAEEPNASIPYDLDDKGGVTTRLLLKRDIIASGGNENDIIIPVSARRRVRIIGL